MANEEKLMEMLIKMDNRLANIETDVSTLKADVSTLKTDVSTLKTDVSTLKTDVSTLKTDVSTLKTDVSTLKSKVANLEENMSAVQGQLNENTQMIKAIRHHQEFAHAKLEALEATTAKSDALIKLDSKVTVLNHRLFEQEATIETLKLAK